MDFVFGERMTSRTTSLRFVTLFVFLFTKAISHAALLGPMNTNSSNSNVMVGCIEMERDALLTFKEGLEDPSDRLSTWVGQDCCEWEGVGCSMRSGSVVKLDLSNKVLPYDSSRSLGGKLNASLLQLKQLNYLNLSNNDFREATIPKFLGSLTKLIYLDLSQASFFGTIPPHLGNLSSLHYLGLHNLYNCWVLDLNWVSRLSSLEYINLDYVNLGPANGHWLQSLNMLPSLSELHLSSCNLQSLPQSLPHLNFSSLSVFDISDNDFSSLMPQWLLNVTSGLAELNLRYCHLEGLFTHVVRSDFCNLQYLDFSYNGLMGEISEFLTGLSRCNNNSLEELDLSVNKLYGQLPADLLGHLSVKLRCLKLYSNTISGQLPASISMLSNLEILDLESNSMNSSISDLWNLTKLTTLRLRDNRWEGVLSENLFVGLKNLKDFRISSSSHALLCNLSHNWSPPFSLEILALYSCSLGPKFPAWLENQTQLKALVLMNASIVSAVPHSFWELSPQFYNLDLSGNQIRGTLPNSLEFSLRADIDLSSNCLEGPLPVWSNVQYLNLRSNLFSGPIPTNIGRVMSSASFLDLSANFINGSIPYSIGQMKRLNGLYISNNSLSGYIHDQWSDLQNLDSLDLSGNNLSGSIPASICELPSLVWLSLSNNNLSGEISLSLANNTILTTLDLGNNKFSGKISEWIGEQFLSLSELRLRGNTFIGEIPQQLCRLPGLHLLDLALNNLSGSIPPCLGNLSGLISSSIQIRRYAYSTPQMHLELKGKEYDYARWLKIVNIINLSSNNLTGEIPKEIAKLLVLGTLNLSRNHLTGKIPKAFGVLQRLETLDLSWNHLSGPLPTAMTSMTSLSHLNLSHNNFSGTIPLANQFLTFDDPSIYAGNPGLCGSPLTKCIVPCAKDVGCKKDQAKGKNDEDKNEQLGLYISIVLGFVVGFWSVCGSLVIKESWRHAFFRFIDNVKDWLRVIVSVNVTRFNRMRGTERN